MDKVEGAELANTSSTGSHFSHALDPRLRHRLPWSIRLVKLAFRLLGTLFPAPMSILAYRLWLSTRRSQVPTKERRVLEAAQTFQFEITGKRVFSWTLGEGPTVLFVHGWNGRGTQFSMFIEPLIERGFSVVGFDATGHGKSDGNTSSGVEFVEALRVLQAKRGPFAAIVGHSFGVLCSVMALANGLDAACFVGISAPANVEGLLEKFARALDMPKPVNERLHSRFVHDFGEDILLRFSTEENAKKLQIPGLIVHDENDPVLPWQEGHIIARAYPGAQFMKTTGLGHSRVLRNAQVVGAVVDFIKQSTQELRK